MLNICESFSQILFPDQIQRGEQGKVRTIIIETLYFYVAIL